MIQATFASNFVVVHFQTDLEYEAWGDFYDDQDDIDAVDYDLF